MAGGLAKRIEETRVEADTLAAFYLAQAGFYFKSASGKTICVDPYLSDCCERLFKFKRMVPPLMSMNELEADFIVATHSHADHLDPDLLEQLKTKPGIRFVGSTDCLPLWQQAGIDANRISILAAGESKTIDGVGFRAIYADHGKLAPDAVGMLIYLDGITIYDTGDTSYCPEQIMKSLGNVKVDIMIVPINPAYGNPGHENAVKLAALVKPQVVIGSHFGMFIEHGGEPGEFLQFASKELSKAIVPLIMAPGERLLYSRSSGIISTETMKTQEMAR